MFEAKDFAVGVAYTPRAGFTLSGAELPSNSKNLLQDLALETVLRAMGGGDDLLFDISTRALLWSLTDPSEILYRQAVLLDCLSHPALLREMYLIARQAIVCEQKIYRPFRGSPAGILHRSVEVLEMFVGLLKRLRQLADDNASAVNSKGMTSLFAMLAVELDDEYFRRIDYHLKQLKFRSGTFISAVLGKGLRGRAYVLRAGDKTKRPWKERIGLGTRTSYYFQLHPRDEAGARFLSTLTDRGVNLAANALAQSVDHILSFFALLCVETGFYVGCLNLQGQLRDRAQRVCMPVPLSSDVLALSYDGIYDMALALGPETRVVGNTLRADGRALVVITGANSGGKSTLLRGIGQAHLMMQCGMFVGAETFCGNVVAGLFTHFIREEDDSMTSGKLDEELARMSEIADHLSSRCMVLFNESFSATDEREGSEIARQIISALLAAGVKVMFVTHQFTLADAFYKQRLGTALFLRAERGEDGRRSFRLIEGEPLVTSFAEDIYHRIGGLAREVARGSPGMANSVTGEAGADGVGVSRLAVGEEELDRALGRG